MVCILRQVTNTQTCGQPQQHVMADILSPFAITSLPTHHSPMVVIITMTWLAFQTGVVAPKCSNADCAAELGIEAAARLTGQNYSDVKLKRNDRVISIGAATNTATVHGQDIEVDPTLLFMRVTCVIRKPSDMGNQIKHEFSKQPPALFQKGVMRKNTKSLLAKHLKAPVVPVSGNSPENSYYVVDGGHILQSVTSSVERTYDDVCDTCVKRVTKLWQK